MRTYLPLTLLSLGLALAGCGGDPEVVNKNTGASGTGGDGGGGGGTGNTGAVGGDTGCPAAQSCGVLGCCDTGEECVNGSTCLPACANERCGENLTQCCGDNQTCLQGALCAADCTGQGALCGDNLDICCPQGDVCLSAACVTPGEPCTNNFDCLTDGWYCEETIGQCLPLPPGPLCEGTPNFNDVEPELEWYWPGVTYNGLDYVNTITAPSVGDVNGDGTPDIVVVMYAGTNESNTIIAVLDGDGDGMGNPNLLFTIPSAADPTAPEPYWTTTVALGNFDADPGLELVYGIDSGGIRIADNDGIGDLGVRTSGQANTVNWGGPSLADLNDDGVPEVIVRCHAMDGTDISNPALDLMNVSGCGENTVVADLNQDGLDEVISYDRAITADPANLGGTTLWQQSFSFSAGFLAVADLLPDVPGPEVINIRNGFFLMNGLTGELLIGPGGSLINGTIPIPGAGQGGAPTVADFDGDGLPEVSTAGSAAYVVYDPDCYDPPLRMNGQCGTGSQDLTLWSTPTQDLSSSRTGSSVFDFQGDGAAEVLYNDECFLHIYDGIDGSELLDPVIPSSSRTAAEYPLVADVDGDGNAEIVVISNRDQAIDRDDCDTSWKAAGVDIDWLCQYTSCTAGGACDVNGNCPDVMSGGYLDSYMCDSNNVCQQPGGTQGVKIYGDAFDSWVKTRPVWNQFAFHVTNFEFANGTWGVPVDEAANWLSFNNYRQNVQGGVVLPVPDLRVELTATPVCPNEVGLTATVYNDGSAGAPAGVDIAFYRTDAGAMNPPELIGTATTSTTILPGGFEIVGVTFVNPPTGVTLSFTATADPNAVIDECDDTDNEASASAMCGTIN